MYNFKNIYHNEKSKIKILNHYTAQKINSEKICLKNKSLIFTIKNESILIEKSIFLGGNKILDSVCITISGNLVNKNKTIHWEIKKNI